MPIRRIGIGGRFAAYVSKSLMRVDATVKFHFDGHL
jgi:hypothetical protein